MSCDSFLMSILSAMSGGLYRRCSSIISHIMDCFLQFSMESSMDLYLGECRRLSLSASKSCVPRCLMPDSSTNCAISRCIIPVSYTHLRAHETPEHLVCRFL